MWINRDLITFQPVNYMFKQSLHYLFIVLNILKKLSIICDIFHVLIISNVVNSTFIDFFDKLLTLNQTISSICYKVPNIYKVVR